MSRGSQIIAYHLCWTAYGTWLPNDPRGSGSHAVAAVALQDLGEVHYGRRSVQPSRDALRTFHDAAGDRLKYGVIRFSERWIEVIGAAFDQVVAEHRYTCYACAILEDHVHLVLRKHRHRAEEMIERFQKFSRSQLVNDRAVPYEHPVWTEGGWRGFLNSAAAVCGAVRYVEENPRKAGMSAQKWAFVQSYDGWPHRRARGNAD